MSALIEAADERAAKKARRYRPADHAPDREGGAAADPRSPLARASRHARASAPGHRLARLRPARSAERIQERELHAVRAHARAPARGGDRPAHACRARAAGRVPPLDAELPPMEAHHVDPTTGEDEFALEAASAGPGSGRGGAAPARARKRAAAPRRGRSGPIPSTWGKVQRNAPCPCGSGKKYKHCHGAYN